MFSFYFLYSSKSTIFLLKFFIKLFKMDRCAYKFILCVIYDILLFLAFFPENLQKVYLSYNTCFSGPFISHIITKTSFCLFLCVLSKTEKLCNLKKL